MNATFQLNSTSRLTDAMFLILYFDTEEGDSTTSIKHAGL